MDDLISRQEAIDAIYHHFPSVSRTRARTMLHEVPSAQPEPVSKQMQGNCGRARHWHRILHHCCRDVLRARNRLTMNIQMMTRRRRAKNEKG